MIFSLVYLCKVLYRYTVSCHHQQQQLTAASALNYIAHVYIIIIIRMVTKPVTLLFVLTDVF